MSTIRVRAKHGILIRSLNPSADQAILEREAATFTVQNGKINVSGNKPADIVLDPSVQIYSPDDRSFLSIEGGDGKWRAYRGAILLQPDGERLRVINKLNVEDYLLGVLPAEMPAAFKEAALKAQAIAARTYAYHALGKHKSAGFDICDGSHCQIYLGADGEKPTCSKAVKDTKGLVLADDVGLITPLYCADCGGRTRSGGSGYARLVSVLDTPADGGDDFCALGPNHVWTAKVTKADLSNTVSRIYRVTIGPIESILLSDTCPDGRSQYLIVCAEGKEWKASLDDLRTILGVTMMKSPWVTAVSLQDENIIFEGRGHGHGYGLCQIGANRMASPPYDKDSAEILAHYYPNSHLSQIEDLPAIARVAANQTSPKKQQEPPLPPLTFFEP